MGLLVGNGEFKWDGFLVMEVFCFVFKFFFFFRYEWDMDKSLNRDFGDWFSKFNFVIFFFIYGNNILFLFFNV